MKQYELETGTIGFLEVEPAKEYRVNKGFIHVGELQGDAYSIDIPDGFKPLSLFSQLKEEDVEEVMPKLWNGYKNFVNIDKPVGNYNRYVCNTALEAIHSLAQHLGLDTTQPIFVIFKPKQKCKCTDEQSWNCIECIKPR